MYVSCDGGCLPLALDGLSPPPDSVELEPPPEGLSEVEHAFREGVEGTPEGGAADEVTPVSRPLIHVGVPLEAVLRDLWKGGPIDGETA